MQFCVLIKIKSSPVLVKIENTSSWHLASYLTSLNAAWQTGWLFASSDWENSWEEREP